MSELSGQAYIKEPAEYRFNFILYGLLGTFSIFISYFILGLFLDPIIDLIFPGQSGGLKNSFGQVLFLLIPSLVFIKIMPLPTGEVLMTGRKRPLSIYIVSILGFIPLILFNTNISYLQELFIAPLFQPYYNKMVKIIEETYKSMIVIDGNYGLIKAVIYASVVPALCEEVLFRGFLFGSLIQKLKPWAVIIISSVIFSLIHFNPIGLFPLLFFAIYQGIIVYYTKSLIIPMIIHFLNNLLSVIAMYSTEISEFDKNPSQIPTGYILISVVLSLSLLIIIIKYLINNSHRIIKIDRVLSEENTK